MNHPSNPKQRLYFWSMLILVESLILLGLFFPAFMENAALQWDATEIYLPWKYFVTEQVKQGFLPLWNPYMSGGFPQHGDPGTWYELSYLFAATHEYNLQSLLFEYLTHLLIASLGFAFLLRRIHTPSIPAGILGIVYSLSGFFLGNAQHLGWVIGFAWLPWLLGLMLGMFRSEGDVSARYAYAVLLGIVAHFQFVGGYLGVTALSLYSAAGVWVFWICADRNHRTAKQLIQQCWGLIVSLAVFIGLSLPALLSFWDLQQLITRTEMLSIQDMQFGHWPWRAITSMWFVEADQTMAEGFADISLINVRWSFSLLVFLVASFTAQLITELMGRNLRIGRPVLLSVGLAVLFFLLAVGPESPVHALVVPRLPLLQLFRFPAIYRGMALLMLLIASAFAIKQHWEVLKRWSWLMALLVVAEVVYGASRDIKNTVLVKIPANEVNGKLHEFSRKGPQLGVWRKHIPLSKPVDSDSQMNAKVPFMNQNQGVYLKQWATDGYNPYQLQVKENEDANSVTNVEEAIIALDSAGNIVPKGILKVGEVFENGQKMAFRGVVYDKNVCFFVVRQTPSKHWQLTSGGRSLAWSSYGNTGIKIPAANHFQLDYKPNYLGDAVFWIFKCTWVLCLMLLIINRIKGMVEIESKKH
ncbi:MAG: hypothetical protein ACKOXR_07675 [Bacteroidota bacterium]